MFSPLLVASWYDFRPPLPSLFYNFFICRPFISKLVLLDFPVFCGHFSLLGLSLAVSEI